MSTSFVHLRVHTEYSLLDSVVRVPELMQAVAQAALLNVEPSCPLLALVCGCRIIDYMSVS